MCTYSFHPQYNSVAATQLSYSGISLVKVCTVSQETWVLLRTSRRTLTKASAQLASSGDSLRGLELRLRKSRFGMLDTILLIYRSKKKIPWLVMPKWVEHTTKDWEGRKHPDLQWRPHLSIWFNCHFWFSFAIIWHMIYTSTILLGTNLLVLILPILPVNYKCRYSPAVPESNKCEHNDVTLHRALCFSLADHWSYTLSQSAEAGYNMSWWKFYLFSEDRRKADW